MADRITYVYIIAKDLEPEFAPPIKVGISQNPYGRSLDIRTSCPFDVAVFATFKAPDFRTALDWERSFHNALEEWRLRGEWFSLTPGEALAKILWALYHKLKNSSGNSSEQILRYMRSITE